MSHLDFGIVAEMRVAYAYPKEFKLKNQVNMRDAPAASRKALNLGDIMRRSRGENGNRNAMIS
jgi:hypothetical protein